MLTKALIQWINDNFTNPQITMTDDYQDNLFGQITEYEVTSDDEDTLHLQFENGELAEVWYDGDEGCWLRDSNGQWVADYVF